MAFSGPVRQSGGGSAFAAGTVAAAGVRANVLTVGAPFGQALPERMGESTGTEYWVDYANGLDANDGLSIGSPKKKLSAVYTALPSTSSARIYLRNNADHVLDSTFLLFPNTKYGTSRANPITVETWPADMNATGLPGTRGEATISGGELRFQPGDLKQNDYNGGAGFNFRLRNVILDDSPGATTPTGQGTALSAVRCDNVRGFELYGVKANRPSFNGALVRGAGRTTTLNGGITSGATAMTVTSAANFLNAVPFYVVLGGGDGVEIVKVTSVGGGTNWTIERAQNGTDAAAHSNGATVEGYWQCGDVQVINFVVEEPSDGTDWAVAHSHGIYWSSDMGFDASLSACTLLNCMFTRRDAARGGAYGVNCYENGDGSIVSNCLSDGFRRGGVTISGEAVHATDDSLWVNNIVTNVSTSSPGPGYAFDSYMTGDFGPGSGNLVRNNLWHTALTYHRSDADANGITFESAINEDPDFVNRSTGDYRLLGTSPAIGQGDPDYMFPTDITGTVRTLSNYALGPYAYVP